MAVLITDDCINCGACEPECPNQAIKQGKHIDEVDPARCSECVGFADDFACAQVCPVECCVVDPERTEAEEALYERTRTLHPEKELPPLAALPANLSRFRKKPAVP